MDLEDKLNQLGSFGFPFKLSDKEINLFTDGDFEPKALNCAVKYLIKSLRSSKTTSLYEVADSVINALNRKFSGNTWFCQIVPTACEIGLSGSLFTPGNFLELTFIKNSIDYRVSVFKVWKMTLHYLINLKYRTNMHFKCFVFTVLLFNSF